MSYNPSTPRNNEADKMPKQGNQPSAENAERNPSQGNQTQGNQNRNQSSADQSQSGKQGNAQQANQGTKPQPANVQGFPQQKPKAGDGPANNPDDSQEPKQNQPTKSSNAA